jgi:hypothetical protein
MTTLLFVQQAILQALIGKMVSRGAVTPDEMVALLDQAERDAAPFVPNRGYAQQTFSTLRQAARAAAPG